VNKLKTLWKAAPVATSVLALALAVALFFAVRMVSFGIYWSDPAHRNQAIMGWMTPGYVAHSWHVPREVVIDAIGAPKKPDGPRNFDQLATDQGVPVSNLIERADKAIAAFRANPPAPDAKP